ncbi:ExeA family protein [Geopsychrobacter electrodiphilus]|uniref:ExeA family protein n=1 Tax=Geopsychrobacter electrodiphilus TaxID=225196 RepID=UPI0024801DA3|nr:ExeA family protein [Geopsychrobacter electrodiphilus]
MFGLKEKPFHITPNPRFIFLSKRHKEAFAHLLYGVRERVGFLSLIGEVGTGKTTVLRTLLSQLEKADYQVALIFNPCISALELLQSIHREFSIPYQEGKGNLASLHETLNLFLLEQRTYGKTVVLVVDEAQNLKPSVLEQMRLLSNLETETDKLLQLIIVGQPELEEVLAQRELRQLKQRLTVRYRLTSMDEEDTVAYIGHRLKIAGFTGGQLFTEKALKMVFRLTGGLPRLINILCDRALLVAYTHEKTQVDHKIIAEAQAELSGSEPLKKKGWSLITVIAGMVCLLGLLLWAQPSFLARIFPTVVPQVPAVAADSKVLRVEKSQTPPVPEIDTEKLEQIKQKISTFSEENSAMLATSSVLKLWGLPPLKRLDNDIYQALRAAVRVQGLDLIRFQNNPEKLIQFNSPAVLSLLLPSLKGIRYLGLLKVKDGMVLTAPKLSADGWIPVGYLEHIWFGKALIPWKNYEKLSYVDDPGKEGAEINRIQELLILAGYTAQKVTGVYDSQTIDTISNLQLKTGLNPDGRIGAQTLLQLYRLAGLEMPTLSEEIKP